MEFNKILSQIMPLPDAAIQTLESIASFITLPKHHQLIKSTRKDNSIYFIRKGLVRAYTQTDDDDVTFWFGTEGDCIIPMYGYIHAHNSYEEIVLLEDSELYKLDGDKLQALYKENLTICNWGRKLAEHELIKTEERLIARQTKSAKESYTNLMIHYPQFLQRIPLQYIASYLGITQVSLSRIRNEIRP